MSTSWIVTTRIVLTLAAVNGIGLPLRAALPVHLQVTEAGPVERGATLVTAQNRIPRPTRVVMPTNPVGRFWPPVVVTVRVTINEQGQVREVRALGPGLGTYSFYISKPMGGEVLAFAPLMEVIPPPPAAFETFVTSAIEAVRGWQYDPPADGPIAFDVAFGFNPPSAARLLVGPVSGTTQVDGPTRVKDVPLVYPRIAQSARVQGVVVTEARVESDGHVSNAKALTGPPLLEKAAIDAVMQWEFVPAVVDGRSVPALVTAKLEFTLMN